MYHLFMFAICMSSLEKCLGLLPIFDWVVCLFIFDIYLYELFTYFRNEYLLVTAFAGIFSHSVGCPLLCIWFP